jgi:hypothetical protein
MGVTLSTYSGRDLNLALQSNLYGTIQANGVSGQGIAQLSIEKTVTQSSVQVGMDGAVVPSVIPGDQGVVEIQVWQTSSLQQEFIAWYNTLQAAELAGDVSNWFSNTILIQNIVDGSSHLCTGVGPEKVPSKVYGDQAARVSWRFICSNIVSM